MASHHGIGGSLYPARYCTHGHHRQDGDRFGRMFPGLPPLYLKPEVLIDIGKVRGKMQAAANAATTKTVPVGQVFFGQFVDHDITLDIDSSFNAVNDPAEIPNTRTPTLDLDCVYGDGPEAQPYMYEETGRFAGVKLRVGGTGALKGKDLPRHGKAALIGDFRNDENRIVSQIQLGMIKVHNAFVDEVSTQEGLQGHDLFVRARQLTTWHYQWCVVHDFLVAMCGQKTVDDILCNGRAFYKPAQADPFMPVEFSVAAYRFGHSMAPLTIQVQRGGKRFDVFGPDDRPSVLGSFRPVKDVSHVVQWPQVFRVGRSRPQLAEQCDAKLTATLLRLPFMDQTSSPEDLSLATRNLRRGQSFLLPSGEQVARHMDSLIPTLVSNADINRVSAAAKRIHRDLDKCTPLWLYCLLEGKVLGRGGVAAQRGEGLGPVGGRIVAEVIIGLLECDPRSWLSSDRSWRPLPANQGKTIVPRDTIGDLLEWAA